MATADWILSAPRLAGCLLLVCLASCGSKTPGYTVGDVDAIEIQLQDWADRQKAANVRSEDPEKIDALLAVLRSAKATGDHKCGDTGKIALHQEDGGKLEIGILAGHRTRYYEFRAYRGESYEMFRVERVAFLKAIRAFGLAELDPGLPD